ncbi:class I SAM-dependent rRNA methyltransferase [Butyrivibrio sp. INlla16]|uniref:class I SAM-dependent rRNA methyltransferase n=1 Tax=Butyrivibrio sp. INlla16 TaxID=1520807 RepID=UPI00088E207C|nr:class I SAM-dependent rRNA methyltransferase [Butyrivibrio sp. INlla16]SDB67791.1 23S rRNA (cytosine1962-C5)-methyltransferase [Butyrivibrio sp. INlla16]
MSAIVVADAKVILKKGEGRTIKAGGAWVFDNEINRVEGSFDNGDIVDVLDHDGYFMGYGFINTNSKIRVRMMSRRKEHPVNEELLETRIRNAWGYRKTVMNPELYGYDARLSGTDEKEALQKLSCRLIFGEADFLPGITIDKFSDVLVIESLALGTDRMKNIILDLCKKVLSEDGVVIRGIYERSDAKVREQEGLERTKGFIGEPFDTKVLIEENGVKYYVDVENGQKTGFFLDQKNNRRAIASLCKGKKVLDCFTHTGSFGLNAAAAGASSVHAVDASDVGCAQAEENAKLNGLENIIKFQCADVFDLLPDLEKQNEQYDVVILDPPAFTKSRASIKKAVTGYREINIRGMKLVKNGGYLATCSCSHFMDEELFAKTIREAARSAHKQLRQVEFRQQAADHPILWSNDASFYLKFYIFQVVEEL